MEHTDVLCGQNAQFLNVKADSSYFYRRNLSVKIDILNCNQCQNFLSLSKRKVAKEDEY
jgi:hypothetical protein